MCNVGGVPLFPVEICARINVVPKRRSLWGGI